MADGPDEAYESFALIYDQIMCSVDYEGWADYVEQLLNRFSARPCSVLDLACGTGSSTIPFARRGYRATGIDISEAMLVRARLKAAESGLDIDFLKRDLCRLEMEEKYDLALLFQDGLNYLPGEEQLACAFSEVYAALNPGGLFIFDLTRPGRRPGSEENRVNWADQDDFTLVWESGYTPEAEIWTIRLTAFYRVENGLYKKFQEQHQEKDFDPGRTGDLLEQAGLSLLAIYPSFRLETAEGTEPKLTFISKKEQPQPGSL
jgi:SAM-dependent methyltransferase